MIVKRIPLDPNDDRIFLDVYIADPLPGLTRKAIMVIPGGGYGSIYLPEGEPVAQAFIPYGYNAFVLHYSTGIGGVGGVYPKQLIQASKAIKHIKDHAEEYNIDPGNLFVIGFSAGGHLAGSIATMWDKKEIYDEIDMKFGYNKPKGVMMVYPVVSGIRKDIQQPDSFQNLLGDDYENEDKLIETSLEKNVKENSCPIFLTLCSNDVVVNVKNSLCLADAYATLGLKFEMHIYPDSMHGFCLGNKVTKCDNEKWEDASIAKWIDNAVYWAENL